MMGGMADAIPQYLAWLRPLHPCRQLPTRHCPAVFEGVCGDRPCARYESDDASPWAAELDARTAAEAADQFVATAGRATST